MSKQVVSGVGVRRGRVFNLDSSGLPLPATASSTMITGTLIQGIKSLTVNDPEAQRFTHYGDDRPFAQDSLPAAEAGNFNVSTAKTNLTLDAMLEGAAVRTVNSNAFRAGNNDKGGSEPLFMFHFYRQALDTTNGSGTFGKLRQWNSRLYMSSRLSPVTASFEQGTSDNTYTGTPTPVNYTGWNEQLTEANWGVTEAEYIEFTTDYQPVINVARGDGTITAFALTHPPVDSSSVTVWQDGTQVTPSSVNTNATNPAFTLGSASTNNKLILALIETNQPGTS